MNLKRISYNCALFIANLFSQISVKSPDSCTMDSGNTDVFLRIIDASVVDPRQSWRHFELDIFFFCLYSHIRKT